MVALRRYSCLFVFACALAGCREEPVPAYLFIPSASITATSGQGSLSQKITDVWIYAEGRLQGVYELPALFPILRTGQTHILVYAGIQLNGIASTRAEYPFYTADTFEILMEPARVDTLYPLVSYTADAIFAFIEDFESTAGFSNVTRTNESADVFEGQYSGLLSAPVQDVVAKSNADVPIPYQSTAVFLEMDYRNTHLFEAGLEVRYGSETYQVSKLKIPARSQWNKLYINFTPEVNQLNADSYRIYFKVPAESDPTAVKILLDNLKLIYAKVP
ncbi:MAG: hypothetical protein KatS3mg031_2380 [Chitinophagales bacterium]|nr:MAG: hypothetical protein KatS3mg031_2380 [Chitinophagales bacterium]